MQLSYIQCKEELGRNGLDFRQCNEKSGREVLECDGVQGGSYRQCDGIQKGSYKLCKEYIRKVTDGDLKCGREVVGSEMEYMSKGGDE